MRKNKTYKEAGKLFLVCLLFFVSACITPAKISLRKTSEGGYLLIVEGRPFLIKGVTYNPTPIGKGYDYDLFSDKNKPWLIDGKLMREMGVNTVRVYINKKSNLNQVKNFIREMYDNFRIYTIVGHWLGLWDDQPNYGDIKFRNKVKSEVLRMVKVLKDEKGVLLWLLGNENNYTFSGQIVFWTTPQIEKIEEPAEKIAQRARIYYSFINELARAIKNIDSNHPVALGNGEANFLDIAASISKDVDILGLIVYRGKRFGNFFENVRRNFDRAIFLSEFGADSYNAYKDKPDEEMQEVFLLSQWEDLYKNTVVSGNKRGNVIGGVIFEWVDEWWKHNEGYSYDWTVHNKEAGWSNGSYYFDIKAPNNLNMNEEWFGIVGISEDKENNINKRIPKKAYFSFKKIWRNIP